MRIAREAVARMRAAGCRQAGVLRMVRPAAAGPPRHQLLRSFRRLAVRRRLEPDVGIKINQQSKVELTRGAERMVRVGEIIVN